MLFDSHAHLASFDDPQLETVLQNASAADVTGVMCVGHNEAVNLRTIDICARNKARLHCAVGYDRSCAASFSGDIRTMVEGRMNGMLALAASRGVALRAVGETGLDYHHDHGTRAGQIVLFETQLDFAVKNSLPVIIHSRESEEDTLRIIADTLRTAKGLQALAGVVHCFTGSVGFASKILDLGLHISISGIVTFKNAADVCAVAEYVPADRLLVETDSPYLSPSPDRGRVNEPARLVHVARKVADIRKVPYEDLCNTTSLNAAKLFRISPVIQ